jgi:hypothetical protein
LPNNLNLIFQPTLASFFKPVQRQHWHNERPHWEYLK